MVKKEKNIFIELLMFLLLFGFIVVLLLFVFPSKKVNAQTNAVGVDMSKSWVFTEIVYRNDISYDFFENLDYDLLYIEFYNDNIGMDSLQLSSIIHPVSSEQEITYKLYSGTDQVVLVIDYNNVDGYTIQFEDYYGVGWLYSLYGITLTDTYTDGYEFGYEDGLDIGQSLGYDIGYEDGYDSGFLLGKQEGYDIGLAKGFNDGVGSATDYSFFGLITQVFVGLGTFLAIELLPHITIGAILAVPLVFGIISFIIGKRRGRDD
jgi:hypothetical protein